MRRSPGNWQSLENPSHKKSLKKTLLCKNKLESNIMSSSKKYTTSLIPIERIESRILIIRGEKVMLDADLADLYDVETKQLVRAMKRNIDRFPDDFMFQLSKTEFDVLRCHFGTSSQWGGRRYPPYAFTEHGVEMLSSILNSQRAIKVNIEIMRIFSKLRKLLATHADMEQKIAQLEKKYDVQFRAVFDAIRELMIPPEPQEKSKIGYLSETQ